MPKSAKSSDTKPRPKVQKYGDREPVLLAKEVEDALRPIQGRFRLQAADRRIARLARILLVRLLYDKNPEVAMKAAMTIIHSTGAFGAHAFRSKQSKAGERIQEILAENQQQQALKVFEEAVKQEMYADKILSKEKADLKSGGAVVRDKNAESSSPVERDPNLPVNA